MFNLIWNLVQLLLRSYLLVFINVFPLTEVRFGYRREFNEVLKCLSKRNKVSIWSEQEPMMDSWSEIRYGIWAGEGEAN